MAVALKRKIKGLHSRSVPRPGREIRLQKHEFYRGLNYSPWLAASVNHGRVVASAWVALSSTAYTANLVKYCPVMSVCMWFAYGLFTYPDTMIICGQARIT